MDENVEWVGKLVNELKEKNKKISDLEEEVKQLKEAKKQLEEGTIPDAMLEIGVNSLTLMTREVVTVKPFYYARVPKEPEQFFTWLRANGFGGMIKDEIKVYPDSDIIEELVNMMKSLGIEHEVNSNVHWKTLESWFKECIEAGAKFDDSLFPHYVGRKVTVKEG